MAVAILVKRLGPCLVAASFMLQAAVAKDLAQSPLADYPLPAQKAASKTSTQASVVPPREKQAQFKLERASHETRHMANWIVDSDDNASLPFAIVDKKSAKVFVFFADGQLRGTAPVLLGLAAGDEAIPGIGDQPLSSIRPEERTTPAGRFVAAMDHNLKGKEILWVDYDGAISMHPVVTSKPKERRLQRLNSPTPLDNRISYGCINVPPKFFKNVVRPAFTGTEGIVYVLPDTKSLKDVFSAYKEASSKQSAHKN